MRCFQRLASQHASERRLKIKSCGCWDTTEAYFCIYIYIYRTIPFIATNSRKITHGFHFSTFRVCPWESTATFRQQKSTEHPEPTQLEELYDNTICIHLINPQRKREGFPSGWSHRHGQNLAEFVKLVPCQRSYHVIPLASGAPGMYCFAVWYAPLVLRIGEASLRVLILLLLLIIIILLLLIIIIIIVVILILIMRSLAYWPASYHRYVSRCVGCLDPLCTSASSRVSLFQVVFQPPRHGTAWVLRVWGSG